MKRVLLEICFVLNVIFLVGLIPLLIIFLLGNDSIYLFLMSEKGISLRLYANIPLLILWVYNFILWSKNDKKIGQFFMLLIFNSFYNPFYYRKAVKRNWV